MSLSTVPFVELFIVTFCHIPFIGLVCDACRELFIYLFGAFVMRRIRSFVPWSIVSLCRYAVVLVFVSFVCVLSSLYS